MFEIRNPIFLCIRFHLFQCAEVIEFDNGRGSRMKRKLMCELTKVIFYFTYYSIFKTVGKTQASLQNETEGVPAIELNWGKKTIKFKQTNYN